jgi:hypothetical protein
MFLSNKATFKQLIQTVTVYNMLSFTRFTFNYEFSVCWLVFFISIFCCFYTPGSGSQSNADPDPKHWLTYTLKIKISQNFDFAESPLLVDRKQLFSKRLKPVLRSRSIFVRLQLRLQLVKNSGSGSSSDNFPHIIEKFNDFQGFQKNFMFLKTYLIIERFF